MFKHLLVAKKTACCNQQQTQLYIQPSIHYSHIIINTMFQKPKQNYNLVLSHCYTCNITLEPMKQPHSTPNEIYKIIKCTNHNKHELKEHCKPQLTEQPLVTPFDTEWTHHRTTSITKVSPSFTFKHTKGLRGRLQGTSHQTFRVYETTT